MPKTRASSHVARIQSQDTKTFSYAREYSVLGEDDDLLIINKDEENGKVIDYIEISDSESPELRSDLGDIELGESFISVGEDPAKAEPEERLPDIQGDPNAPWRPPKYTPRTLDEDIKLFVCWMGPRPEEQHSRKIFTEQITTIIKQVCGQSCKPLVFGSYPTGLYLPTSDIDLVVMDSEIPNPIQRLSKALRKENFVSNMQVIAKARIPLIKFEHRQTGMQMDISFGKDNGPKNTVIVQSLLDQYENAKPLMILLKYILKQRGLNEVYTGGIGSYALFLLIISFLQQRDRDHDAKSVTMATLLIDFCELYGREFNYYYTGISVGDGGYFSKEEKGWYKDSQGYLLSVEDPQDEDNDVTKSSFAIYKIRNALNKVFLLLSSSRKSLALLDAIFNVDRELLQYRFRVQKLFGDGDENAYQVALPSSSSSPSTRNKSKHGNKEKESPKKGKRRSLEKEKKGRDKNISKNWEASRSNPKRSYKEDDYQPERSKKRKWRSNSDSSSGWGNKRARYR